MISDTRIDEALEFLNVNASELGRLHGDALEAHHMVSVTEALQMKLWNEESAVAQKREARASSQYKEAIFRDAKAAADHITMRARINAAEKTIAVWQSQIKLHTGVRP